MYVPVYIPFGELEYADLIAEFNGKLNKIQVKTSNKFDNGFSVDLRSSTIKKGKDYSHKYDENDIDYFAIYNIESKTSLLLPIKEFSGRNTVKFNIPYIKDVGNHHKPLNWEDYTFEKIVETAYSETKIK